MNNPCPKRTDCECIDSPYENLTSEGLDVTRYVRQTWVPIPVTDGPNSNNYTACRGLCISYVSQEEADECARNMAMECGVNTTDTVPGEPTPDNPIIPVGLFFNSQRTVSDSCPDNSDFYVVIRSGRFSAPSQLEADMIADSWARNVSLPQYKFCCTVNADMCCNVNYGRNSGQSDPGTIQLAYVLPTSGYSPFTVEVIGGSLPTGISIDPTQGNDLSFDFVGIPTVGGQYSVTLKITDSQGNYLQKQAIINVVCVTTGNPMPDGTVSTPYTQNLAAAGGSGSYVWRLKPGTSLPPGLILYGNGTIAGTPTQAGTYNFTVECQSQ